MVYLFAMQDSGNILTIIVTILRIFILLIDITENERKYSILGSIKLICE